MKNRNISKFLSLILRHQPEILGIQISENGWASTQEIIEKMTQRGMSIDLATIRKVVSENDKQRFKLSEDNSRIRANQGHSIEVAMGFESLPPPMILYHGTARKNLESIMELGLLKAARQHVHLSANKATATKVGQRHGIPVVLIVLAEKMEEQGFEFYRSENGVWLTDFVAPEYIRL